LALRHHLLLIYMFLFPSTRFPMIPNESKLCGVDCL
jgi:hypothetical protein